MDYDGGWAQYALARKDTLLPIPDHLPFDQDAITADAVSTPYAAIVDTGAVRPAQAVGIWGAGGLSAHGIRLARLVGAAPVIAVDPLPSARERALFFGADHALDPMAGDFAEAVHEATAGRGIDVAFEFAGVGAARAQATTVLGPNGVLVLAGLIPEPVTVADSIDFCFNVRQTADTTAPSRSTWNSSSDWPPPGASTSAPPSAPTSRWPKPQTPSPDWRRRSETRSASCSPPK
ncbi:zinc-binding dehydrogenase [Streptomyces lavendofoliae]|uniref:zinc-binding dehydrogenase n=1 Tax=Streptomyces lavendofoliae TaxID=67314 RepID=UPI003D89D6E5